MVQTVKYVKICTFKYINFKTIIILSLVNACNNNPCLNGATCQSNGNSYTCTCAQFYSGTNCQTCNYYN